tara:strand:+ start:6003 stop:6338 length:336 start_codon:yes stop_codon:yes gene_type:complete
MRKIFYKIPYFLFIYALLLVASCTTYSTSYNERQEIDLDDINNVKKGQACTKNLFGGIDFPLVGNIAIKLTGEQSVIDALKNGNITDVYSIDRSVIHYLLYSKKCTIVYGK